MNDNEPSPVDGSWVAEVEDAEEELAEALLLEQSSESNDDDDDSDPGNPNPGTAPSAGVVRCYVRVCRAYRKLRRWDRLLAVATEGHAYACGGGDVAVFASLSDGRTAAAGTAVGPSSSSPFREFCNLASTELAVQTMLDLPNEGYAPAQPNLREFIRHRVLEVGASLGPLLFMDGMNNHLLQEAALRADVRLMEEAVALGAPIDVLIAEPRGHGERISPSVPYPPGASPLVVACARLAVNESTDPTLVRFRASGTRPGSSALNKLAECATQLVHLGADPNLTMPRGLGPANRLWWPFGGKSAFQIASMTKRRPLVALMLEHMRMSREERAEVVHCRCGSRLPWKQCHLAGDGQPSHYVLDATTQDTHYRLSPLARCPCKRTNQTYYQCCWKDNRVPVYLNDKRGASTKNVDTLPLSFMHQRLRELEAHAPAAASALRTYKQGSDWMRDCAGLFPDHPSLFAALCETAGPKSRMAAWDPRVYAGCAKRLKDPFFWRDVHWDLDRSILVWRADEWNKALHQYCDDAGLEGAERALVVTTHAANPCSPCGNAGCSAFESTVRQFYRCARCKSVAYCCRKCQKKDWAEQHKKVCQALPAVLHELGQIDGLVNYGRG